MRTSSAPNTRRPITLLLRSGWQTANIGDIAHTFGVLRALALHAPAHDVIVWPGHFDRGVEPLLRGSFPGLRFVKDAAQWRPPSPDAKDVTLAEAFAQADLLIHGSGPGLVAQGDMDRWRKETGKPWAVFGITIGSSVGRIDTSMDFPAHLRECLNSAALVLTRETRSLEAARMAGVSAPLGFMPDCTFAIDDLRDEAAADRLMAAHKLETDRFICVIPRLRLTPYWRMPGHGWNMSPEVIEEKERFNAQHVEADHAKLREAIVAWVRTTGQRVLICPEMTYAPEIFEPHLLRPLPADVRPYVSALDRYWITDEASSVYARSRFVLSIECHSPILAIAAGRPAFYVHQPQDTWKSQMYADVGLGDWAIPIESISGEELARRVLAIDADSAAARQRATSAAQQARAHIAEGIRTAMSRLGATYQPA